MASTGLPVEAPAAPHRLRKRRRRSTTTFNAGLVPLIALLMATSHAADAFDPSPMLWTALGKTQCEKDPWSDIREDCIVASPARHGLRALVKQTSVSIILPGIGGSVVITGKVDPSSGVWQGTVVGDPLSSVTILPDCDGQTNGMITLSKSPNPFRIRTTKQGVIVEKLKPVNYLNDIDEEGASDCRDAVTPTACGFDTPPKINVLVTFTDIAKHYIYKGAEGIRCATVTAIAATNGTLKGLNVSLTAPPPVRTKYPEMKDISLDKKHVRHYQDVLENRRDNNGDIVVVLVSTSGSPKADLMGSNKTEPADDAFVVMPVEMLTVPFVLAHELGHILGAGHHTSAGVFPNSCAHYQDEAANHCTMWKTIMVNGDPCGACPPLPRWSNPQELENCSGLPLGRPDRNNAATLNATACTVEGYR